MPVMVPTWPELGLPDTLAGDNVLAAAHLPIRQLGPAPLVEVWRSSLPVVRAGGFCWNGAVLFGMVSARGSHMEEMTERLYLEIRGAARTAGYPHLLRVWNYVGGINECERDLERYRRFCVGRHAALARLGYAHEQYPAASAVGMRGEGVIVHFLASRAPGVQVENPRQVAAYDYPVEYGPRSPSFSRATVAQWEGGTLIFLAGTSSVVGHETRHPGDVEAQLDETLRNLEKIVAVASSRAGRSATLDDMPVVKTYLRRPADYELVRSRLTARLPRARHLFLEADICRRDLLIEIEGVVRV